MKRYEIKFHQSMKIPEGRLGFTFHMSGTFVIDAQSAEEAIRGLEGRFIEGTRLYITSVEWHQIP